MPEVYFDPRSVHREDGAEWACLHAKCVVIDEAVAFVTSANLTEAAQARNIEAGVLVEDEVFARALLRQFQTLVHDGGLSRLL
jgi:phosphatidylserine/phosphatidylglycerophosphate/cardiolipin synthase-like enzyme